MDQNLTLTYNGHHFTEKKEEVYFTAEFTLPRVGRVSAKYIADRYLARYWGSDNVARDKWTEWRAIRQGDIAGVGPKTAGTVRETVNPAIIAWLNSDKYAESRQTAIAHYIAREAQDSRYGFSHAKRLLETYRKELIDKDHTRLAQAFDHLEAAEALLKDEN